MKMPLLLLFISCSFLLKSQTNIESLEMIKKYQDSVKLTFGIDNIVENWINNIKNDIDTATFNISVYMKMFDAIKLNKNHYVYGCFYFDNFMYCEPYIYVRKKSFNLIKSAYHKAHKIRLKGVDKEDFINYNMYFFVKDSINKAINNIIPEDNERGYLQYLFFCEFGELFALGMSSSPKYKYLLFDRKSIEDLIYKYESINSDVNILELKKLEEINPSPTTKMNDNNCVITWYEVTIHGVFKRIYKIDRFYPFKIVKIEEEELVELNNFFLYKNE